jgi:hypothetical protein
LARNGRPFAVSKSDRNNDIIEGEIGGRGRDRTGDPLLAKQVLSQLSYTPTSESFYSKAFLKPLHRSLAGGLTNAPVAAPGRGDC